MERYCYFSPEIITEDELKAGYKFTHDLAKERNFKRLIICVNNIQANQFIEKIFNSTTTKKLERYGIVVDGQVNIKLKTPKGLKSFDDIKIVFAIHPSQQLLQKLESNLNIEVLVVIAEVPPNGILKHLDNWADENNVERLEINPNK